MAPFPLKESNPGRPCGRGAGQARCCPDARLSVHLSTRSAFPTSGILYTRYYRVLSIKKSKALPEARRRAFKRLSPITVAWAGRTTQVCRRVEGTGRGSVISSQWAVAGVRLPPQMTDCKRQLSAVRRRLSAVSVTAVDRERQHPRTKTRPRTRTIGGRPQPPGVRQLATPCIGVVGAAAEASAAARPTTSRGCRGRARVGRERMHLSAVLPFARCLACSVSSWFVLFPPHHRRVNVVSSWLAFVRSGAGSAGFPGAHQSRAGDMLSRRLPTWAAFGRESICLRRHCSRRSANSSGMGGMSMRVGPSSR